MLGHHPLVKTIRPLCHKDLETVLAIERQTHRYPWLLSHFTSSLASTHQCLVLQGETHILAYGIVSTAADEAELLNFTVAPAYQRQGLGRFFLAHLCQGFDAAVTLFFLEVRASNHAAIALYQAEGFNEVGTRRNYYPADQGREDAIIMAKSL
ncbi:MAG: ribosomal protein S18-alanine N-acetyltransferase [Cellvibrionaceae bacterium]|nr:ribosomal protein S18-alanine N-acetyltransferase [Cellvibrionaceae bacterium]